MRFNYILFCFLILSAVISCKKSQTPAPKQPLVQTDVYVAGTALTDGGKITAAYWKNGSINTLTHPANFIAAGGFAVAVSANDVYVVGHVQATDSHMIATYWKNNIATQ